MGLRTQNLALAEGAGALIQSLIHERTGMFFDNGKRDLLLDKLSPLVIERGFTSYLDYYYLLKYDASAHSEWQTVMNALRSTFDVLGAIGRNGRIAVKVMIPNDMKIS